MLGPERNANDFHEESIDDPEECGSHCDETDHDDREFRSLLLRRPSNEVKFLETSAEVGEKGFHTSAGLRQKSGRLKQ